MKVNADTKAALIKIAEEKNVYIEGNILKIIDDDNDIEFRKYLDSAIERDKEARTKRLEITKQIQQQNRELNDAQIKNTKLMDELRSTLVKAETAKPLTPKVSAPLTPIS